MRSRSTSISRLASDASRRLRSRNGTNQGLPRRSAALRAVSQRSVVPAVEIYEKITQMDYERYDMQIPWLLVQKITVPDRVAGYVHRAELGGPGHADTPPADGPDGVRRFRQDHPPCGVLPQFASGRRGRRLVSLDERDEPAVLDTYITVACQSAGLDLPDVSDLEGSDGGPEHRIGVVARKIQVSGKPFVIAFDELERLENPASLALLEFLIEHGPSNLHLAMAGSANARRIEYGRRRAGRPGPARDDRGNEVFEVPCGRVLRPEVVARRAGRRDETFPGMAVRLAHLPQPDAARQRWGRRRRSGHRRELDRVAAVRRPWRR